MLACSFMKIIATGKIIMKYFLLPTGVLASLLHCLAALCLLLAVGRDALAQEPSNRQILVLNSLQYGAPVSRAVNQGIVTSLTQQNVGLDDIFVEYLDLQRFPDPAHRANVHALLKHKLVNKHVGLIIVTGQSAANFLAREGGDLFPDAPMLSIGAPVDVVWSGKPRKIIDLSSKPDPAGTLRHAMGLFPNTKFVMVVSGVNDSANPFLEETKKVAEAWKSKLTFEYTTDLPYDAILRRIAALPQHSIVLLGPAYLMDRTGSTFTPVEVAARVGKSANAPVFGMLDFHVEQGLVGGSVGDTEELGERAGKIAVDYLQGRFPLEQNITQFPATYTALFDWQQIVRWNGDKNSLPANATILNRPPTIWDEHKLAVVGTLSVFFCMFLLVIALLIQRSQRRFAQFRVKSLNVELERRVVERTTQYEQANIALHEARKRADTANHAKSIFLTNMSHELRTPMNAVLGMLQLLRRTTLTLRQLDYITKTESSARSQMEILNDLIDFSKVETGNMTLDPQVFRMDQLLNDLSVILSANVGNKPVEILFDIDSEEPGVLVGDAMRLRQVLINLAGNALKFTEHGAVVISVRHDDLTEQEVTLKITVTDTGIGISPENQQRIFEGFSQAEASTTRRYGGTGLGLAISQRFVRLMGGELTLTSELGVGSTFGFSLRLPLGKEADLRKMAAPAEVEVALPPALGRLAGLRLLVVEDNNINQMVAQELLASVGAHVSLANDGRAGVEAIEQAEPPFDAILMDLQMPVMDGFAATREIRQRLGLKTLPIIAMTANAMEADRIACFLAGMNDHVGKPFDLSQLIDTILQHIETATGSRSVSAPAATIGACAAVVGPGESGQTSVELPVSAESAEIDDKAALLRLGGRSDLYIKMIKRFQIDKLDMASHLAQHLRGGELSQAARIFHTLKGLSATVGVVRLARLAADAEARVKTVPQNLDVEGLISQINQEMDATGKVLDGLLGQLEQKLSTTSHIASDAIPNTDTDHTILLNSLVELKELLASANLRALDVYASVKKVNVPASWAAWHQKIQVLDQEMERLDFQQSQLYCKELIQICENEDHHG